ncbi:RHS repeat domain-containing protein [Psychroserpens sp. Hel_I_66]|uniref:RHS repeat domain-containing protein n=1 Tax=Psychroserpens sp. Hel_I_66 TaxID=1250004 RepID=UPI001E4904C5|nr:RHS repeat-associated core domain-containing protein [Psychroserpens sp. Hel_I_66]
MGIIDEANTGLNKTYTELGQSKSLIKVQEGKLRRYNHDINKFDTYWYHSDHLGSSSYITNQNGVVAQHMEYLPYGESLVEEHQNSYNVPYKFNAKELDNETGNYYYEARYYNPKWSTWLSVDPLREKGSQYSPYCYTFNNPINLTDPTGEWPDPPTWKKFKNIYTYLSKNSTIFVFQEIPQHFSNGRVNNYVRQENKIYKKILLNQGSKAGSPMVYISQSISGTQNDDNSRPAYRKTYGRTTSNNIYFKGNQNTLKTDLTEYAQNIINTGSIVDIQGRTNRPSGATLLNGTINGETRDDWTTNDLVNARAETIYNELMSLGVPEEQMNILAPRYNAETNTIISINQKPNLEILGIKPKQIKE